MKILSPDERRVMLLARRNEKMALLAVHMPGKWMMVPVKAGAMN